MRRIIILILICALIAASVGFYTLSQGKPCANFAAYYKDAVDQKTLSNYDYIIIEPGHYKKAPPTGKALTHVIAYISLGEVAETSPHYPTLKDTEIFMHYNQQWKSHAVDVRLSAWKEYVVNTLVKKVIDKGFNAVMFDTLDTVLYQETLHPQKYKGMKMAVIEIIAAVKDAYPTLNIYVNRGFDALADIAPYIDGVIVESTLTYYQGSGSQAYFHSPTTYKQLVEKVKRDAPGKIYLSIDYWPENDTHTIAHIYQTQRRNGMIPFVSEPALHTLNERKTPSCASQWF
jgi:uncharacterized protein (TIGR01370 family)